MACYQAPKLMLHLSLVVLPDSRLQPSFCLLGTRERCKCSRVVPPILSRLTRSHLYLICQIARVRLDLTDRRRGLVRRRRTRRSHAPRLGRVLLYLFGTALLVQVEVSWEVSIKLAGDITKETQFRKDLSQILGCKCVYLVIQTRVCSHPCRTQKTQAGP